MKAQTACRVPSGAGHGYPHRLEHWPGFGMLQLTGHQGIVHAVAVARDGQTLCSAGQDGTIRIWNLLSGTETARLDGHEGPVLTLALHRQGNALASGGADGFLKLWNLKTRQLVHSTPKQLASITGVAWLPTPATLLVASGERSRKDRPGEIRLCNFDEPAKTRNVRTEAQGIWSLTSASHGSHVAWGGGQRGVMAWDVTRQDPKYFRQAEASLVVTLDDAGTKLASTVDRIINLWDVPSHREIATLEGHRGLVRALAFSPDGRWLMSGGQDHTVRLWHPAAGTTIAERVFEWQIGGIHAVAFSSDGSTAIAAGSEGTIVVWDMDD